MHIGLLTIEFYLEGCTSLKEKRRRLSGIRERYGKNIQLAVCESGRQNDHKSSIWSFIAVSTDNSLVHSHLDKILESIEDHVDAVISGTRREEL